MIKKTFVVVLVALLAVFTMFEVSSDAKVMEFEHFSIDVPDGWGIEEDEQNSTVTFVAPDESAGLSIAVFASKGQPLEKIAEMLMTRLNGENLEKSSDAYTFQFKNEGFECHGIVGGDENQVLFLSIIGEHADIMKMINSMEGKTE